MTIGSAAAACVASAVLIAMVAGGWWQRCQQSGPGWGHPRGSRVQPRDRPGHILSVNGE